MISLYNDYLFDLFISFKALLVGYQHAGVPIKTRLRKSAKKLFQNVSVNSIAAALDVVSPHILYQIGKNNSDGCTPRCTISLSSSSLFLWLCLSLPLSLSLSLSLFLFLSLSLSLSFSLSFSLSIYLSIYLTLSLSVSHSLSLPLILLLTLTHTHALSSLSGSLVHVFPVIGSEIGKEKATKIKVKMESDDLIYEETNFSPKGTELALSYPPENFSDNDESVNLDFDKEAIDGSKIVKYTEKIELEIRIEERSEGKNEKIGDKALDRIENNNVIIEEIEKIMVEDEGMKTEREAIEIFEENEVINDFLIFDISEKEENISELQNFSLFENIENNGTYENITDVLSYGRNYIKNVNMMEEESKKSFFDFDFDFDLKFDFISEINRFFGQKIVKNIEKQEISKFFNRKPSNSFSLISSIDRINDLEFNSNSNNSLVENFRTNLISNKVLSNEIKNNNRIDNVRTRAYSFSDDELEEHENGIDNDYDNENDDDNDKKRDKIKNKTSMKKIKKLSNFNKEISETNKNEKKEKEKEKESEIFIDYPAFQPVFSVVERDTKEQFTPTSYYDQFENEKQYFLISDTTSNLNSQNDDDDNNDNNNNSNNDNNNAIESIIISQIKKILSDLRGDNDLFLPAIENSERREIMMKIWDDIKDGEVTILENLIDEKKKEEDDDEEDVDDDDDDDNSDDDNEDEDETDYDDDIFAGP